MNGLAFSISHRIMSKILNSDFIEKSRFESDKIMSFELIESESLSKKQFCVCSAYANPDYDVGIDVSLKDKPMINVKTTPEEFLDRLRKVFKVVSLI